MAHSNNRPLHEYTVKVPPDGHKNVWCPLCDWHMADSITARKRMGQHITDNHPKDILFEKGKEPNDFETESVAK